MANPIIGIRDKKIARSNVTLVEPFDPAKASAVLDAERFKGRVRMKDGNSMLIERAPADFARAPDFQFRHLGAPDGIATNPDVAYRVEARLDARVTLAHALEWLPSLEDDGDHFVTGSAGLRVALSEAIFLDLRIAATHDSTPAEDAEETNVRYLLGAGVKF